MSDLELISQHMAFGGSQEFYQHSSDSIGLRMRFGVYRPPQERYGNVPTLIYLAGLTCNEETFAIKAGAQRIAAELGLRIVMPDTSPRGAEVPGEADSWDMGVGAGFYLDATQDPWSRNWRMASYITKDLHTVLIEQFNMQADRVGIFGHSMGGHGALTLALKNPNLYQSVSAFAPIASPSRCPWGKNAFSNYLGESVNTWAQHDATELIKAGARLPHLLIDQGLADKFLAEQLHPHILEATCREVGQPITLRRHVGYDHGYFFIASFIEDHLRYHFKNLTSDGK